MLRFYDLHNILALLQKETIFTKITINDPSAFYKKQALSRVKK